MTEALGLSSLPPRVSGLRLRDLRLPVSYVTYDTYSPNKCGLRHFGILTRDLSHYLLLGIR